MSDANLLAFGCAVTFIGLAGVYVYIRECFTAVERRSRQSSKRSAKAAEREVQDVA